MLSFDASTRELNRESVTSATGKVYFVARRASSLALAASQDALL